MVCSNPTYHANNNVSKMGVGEVCVKPVMVDQKQIKQLDHACVCARLTSMDISGTELILSMSNPFVQDPGALSSSRDMFLSMLTSQSVAAS